MNWDEKYLGLAEHVASWSKDPSTKVGAVIVDPKFKPISFGFNGLPQGLEDTDERLGNRELKYKMILHAEENAILFSQRDLTGCTIYVWPFQPCSSCASKIIQTGIKRVVSRMNTNKRWEEDFRLSSEMFEEAGIGVALL